MKYTGNKPFGTRQTGQNTSGIFSAGTEVISIDANGNIGIGTASPSSALDVSGNILISGGDSQISFYAGSQTGYRLYRNSTTMVLRSDGTIKEDAGSRYQINTNGSERLRVDSNGNVGIGTTTPTAKLEVAASSSGSIKFTQGANAYQQQIETTGHTIFQRPDNHIFQVKRGTTTDVYIQSNGNVGIGTTSPSKSLHVSDANDAPIRVESTDNTTGIQFKDPGGDNSLYYVGSGDYFYTTANVGIGTTSPSAKFHLHDSNSTAGGAYASPYFVQLERSSSGGSPLATYFTKEQYTLGGIDSYSNSLGKQLHAYISSTGTATNFRNMMSRVHTTSAGAASIITHYATHLEASGTGTIDQWYGLSIGNGGGSAFQNANATINNTYGLYLAELTAGNQTNPAYAIYQQGTERVYLQGNVGIGTTSPSTKLDIAGVFQFSTASDLLQINNNTNTGGINLSGNNSRIYFGGHRAIEGNQGGSTLTLGEGYSTVQIHSNAAFVASGNQTIGGNLVVSGRADFQKDLRLRGTDSSPNVGVVRMYVDNNDTLFIDTANDGNNRVEINSAGDLTVPGIITAQEFRTEYISQTIIFESGSTTFGDDADDVHTRNGSVIINKNHTGVLTGNRVDALVINNDQMSGTGPETRIKFQANSNPTATISTKVDSSGVGGGLSFEVAENSTTLTTRLKISKEGFIGMNTDPASNALLKLGLRNMNGDGIQLYNTNSSVEVAKLYQDNGTEGILSLSNSGLEHVKIRSNGSSFFDGGAVGFGTQNPSPSHKVDIVGDLKVGGTGTGTGNYLEIIGFNQSNTVILRQFDSNSGLHSFRFETAVDGLFTFRNGGSNELVRFGAQRNYFAKNVGIGTVSAATSLDIVDEDPIIRLEDTITGAYSLVSGNGGNITLSADEGSQDGGSHILFRTDTTDRMRIDSAGNIRFHNYGAGVLTTDSAGNVGVSTGYITQTAADTRYVNTTGDTMTGRLTISSSDYNQHLNLRRDAYGMDFILTGSRLDLQPTASTNELKVLAKIRTTADLQVDNNVDVYGSYLNLGRSLSTAEAALTIGGERTDSGFSYIDLVGDTTYTDYGARFIRGNTGANASTQLRHRGTGSLDIYAADNATVRFITNSLERARVAGNGNFGIGNTSPATKLAVAGAIQSSGGGAWASNAGGAQLTYNGTNTGILSMYYDDQSLVLGAGISQKNNITISGHTADNTIYFRVGNAERMRIASDGKVGIGTAAPSVKLTINDSESGPSLGSLWVTSHLRIGVDTTYAWLQSHSSKPLSLNPSGNNVGIGTTNPIAKLDVAGDTRSTGFQVDSGGRYKIGNLNQYITGYNDTAIDVVTGGTVSLRVADNGNVGIGTTSPTYGLHVNANAYVNDLAISSAGDLTFVGNALIQTNNNSFILNADVNANGAGFISLRASNVERLKVTTTGAEVTGELSIQGPATVVQTANQIDGTPAGTSMEVFDGNTYVGAFIDYTVYDDTRDHMRSGTIQMVFNAIGEARFTDNSTTDIGDSSSAYFQVASTAPNTEIKFVAPGPEWHVRYHVRYL